MNRTVFLAGATGIIGQCLSPILVMDGWRVFGTTRFDQKVPMLRSLGVEAVVVDVFNADELQAAMAKIKPAVVVHQLTDLPPGLDPAKMTDAFPRNARIRDEGTRNLVVAAINTGVRRMIAQSIAFAYADGPLPHAEHDALAIEAAGTRGVSARDVAALERQVLQAPLAGLVLRYGRLYGPGTGFDAPSGLAPLHVHAAARAAQLAMTRGGSGIYNVAEGHGAVLSEKAQADLGWSCDWRMDPTHMAGR